MTTGTALLPSNPKPPSNVERSIRLQEQTLQAIHILTELLKRYINWRISNTDTTMQKLTDALKPK